MSAKQTAKDQDRERTVTLFNEGVLRKEFPSINKIEKTVSFCILLQFSDITAQWGRCQCQGPMFLASTTNLKLKLIILNQLGKINYPFHVANHMQFQLKEDNDKDIKNYYLNIKVSDTIGKAKLMGIWTTDPRIVEIYSILTKPT